MSIGKTQKGIIYWKEWEEETTIHISALWRMETHNYTIHNLGEVVHNLCG